MISQATGISWKDKLLRHGHFTITVMAEDGGDLEDENLDEKQLPDVALMDRKCRTWMV